MASPPGGATVFGSTSLMTSSGPPGSCRLPMRVQVDGRVVGATLTLPGGTAVHPEVVRDGDRSSGFAIHGDPTLTSTVPDISRLADGRWVPVPMQDVTRDLDEYADAETAADTSSLTPLSVTQLTTGTTSVLRAVPGIARILGWIGRDLYVAAVDDTGQHLIAVDPSTGRTRQLTVPAGVDLDVISNGVLWGTDTSAGVSARFNEIVRLDPVTMATTPWLTANTGLGIIGFTRTGAPIVWTYDVAGSRETVSVVATAGSMRTLLTVSNPGLGGGSAKPGPDDDVVLRLWDGTHWVHTGGGAVTTIGRGVTVPVDDGTTGEVIALAGPCT